MLHDVKLVVYDPEVECPLLNAPPIWLRFLLAFLAKSQGLAGFQIAHHRQEFLLLAQVDLIYPNRRSAGLRLVAAQRSR
jgi:hypothetical protein